MDEFTSETPKEQHLKEPYLHAALKILPTQPEPSMPGQCSSCHHTRKRPADLRSTVCLSAFLPSSSPPQSLFLATFFPPLAPCGSPTAVPPPFCLPSLFPSLSASWPSRSVLPNMVAICGYWTLEMQLLWAETCYQIKIDTGFLRLSMP